MPRLQTLNRLATGLLIAALPAAAVAHVGGHAHDHAMTMGQAWGVGFLHPLTGVDHVLAMVGLGLWISTAGIRQQATVAGVFLAAMGLAAMVGTTGLSLPGVESMIALSVLVIGVMMASGRGFNLAAASAMAFTFALFHGFAHGAEMGSANAAAYFAGFLPASALLIAGASCFASALRQQHRVVLRPVGGVIAAVGVFLLVGIF